jgi:hypothetical protein
MPLRAKNIIIGYEAHITVSTERESNEANEYE